MTPLNDKVLQRFWSKVDKTGDCWLWTGSSNNLGYPTFWHNGTMAYAHRLSYEIHCGSIPLRLEIDHSCRTRLCINPAHLRTVTRRQNLENRSATRKSKSGIRNVYPIARSGLWLVQVRRKHIGVFDTIEEAEAAAIEARNQVMTHNDLDRIS